MKPDPFEDSPTLSPFSRGWHAYCRAMGKNWLPLDMAELNDRKADEEFAKGFLAASRTVRASSNRAKTQRENQRRERLTRPRKFTEE